jgi:nucleotide-binding universal stress UspA family protein
MTRWKKICCAVDLSECTPLLVRHAGELAAWLGADLVLLHVLAPVPPTALDMVTAEDGRELDTVVQHELRVWADEARTAVTGAVTTVVVHGSPAGEVLRFAEASGVDAIVVGTHGRRGIERLVLGSVAEQVVRRSRCPVVVIRTSPGPAESARTLGAADVTDYG